MKLPILVALMVSSVHLAYAAGFEPEPVAFSEIGARATADYHGHAIRIEAREGSAKLHTTFQKLSGGVTYEGLQLESTAEKGGAAPADRGRCRPGEGGTTGPLGKDRHRQHFG